MVGAGDCGGRYGRGSDGGSGVVSGGGAELREAGVVAPNDGAAGMSNSKESMKLSTSSRSTVLMLRVAVLRWLPEELACLRVVGPDACF